MNIDNSNLKTEFLKLFLDFVLANFTAIVVFVLVGKHLFKSYSKLPDFIPLFMSYSFTVGISLIGFLFFYYMLYELYLKRMMSILGVGKFSNKFYIFSSLSLVGFIVFTIISIIA
ncbi:hypothetical protein [Acinetobacter calcoaceticus]|uniref:Uncharacterized protein n=1 Tax=Acinetobacter calcoaceticus TaxID=471 RepID=A0ABD5AQJ5_ACICA|nr:hypothetical protein [Acinetobacter calcoaceticus]MDP9804813.1 hypothetical protein [Acinetobacter calcoaceticus]